MFIPITKVDAARRLVYGLATAETEDRAGEICDYATTKPLYEKWSEEIAKSTGGKSLGNLRAMHGPIAAGKVTAITFNDAAKQIEICAKVVDDAEWTKVQEGVYTGFSQGGAYERRWTDAEGLTRYTAAPTEISLVDFPCLPQAQFEMIKADGTSEQRDFGPSSGNAARIASLIKELDWLRDFSALDEDQEGDSGNWTELRDLVERTLAALRSVAEEEGADISPDNASASATKLFGAPLKTAPLKAPHLAKIGARNSAADQARIQHVHDAMVDLGAVCTTQKIMRGGLEKRFDALAETLADVLRRVKNIEEQPLPLPLAGHSRMIAKAEDIIDPGSSDAMEKLLTNPDALSVLAIKLAQRNGRMPPR
ncbi:hypothetical protein CU048_04555 [Beijerinckiaceae bacterium]|nr:hypothetical protein CU048_04555 [Beijerinckiaceae bacterium]